MIGKINESLIVGFDSTNGEDHSVLIVGRKTPGNDVIIINAFSGKEAEELYLKLITKRRIRNAENNL